MNTTSRRFAGKVTVITGGGAAIAELLSQSMTHLPLGPASPT